MKKIRFVVGATFIQMADVIAIISGIIANLGQLIIDGKRLTEQNVAKDKAVMCIVHPWAFIKTCLKEDF